MRNDSKGATHRYAFDNVRELVQWIEATPRRWRYDASVSEQASRSWDLLAGFSEAMKLAKAGWLEGAGRVQNKLKRLEARQVAPRLANDVYGFRPHVPRYCAGAPDHMVRHDGDTGGGQSLCLYVNIGATCSVDAECMANYGVAIAHYVKQLELEGTRCEVHAISHASISGHRCIVSCKVKSAGQPLDLASLAFAIGHPAMLRRLIFAVRERSTCRASSGYGSSQHCKTGDAIGAPLSAVTVNGMLDANSLASTPEIALESLAREIAKQKKG